MIRYPFWVPEVGQEEHSLVHAVLESDFLNDGEYTRRFERRLAELLGCQHVVAVTSGTAALFLALVGLNIGPGDEVIVPDITFIGTANAVSMCGAMPVLVDVDPNSLCIDFGAAERAITSKTRAIIPVHISGRAADLTALKRIASQRGLHIVEDAAEALGSKHNGQYLGTIGKAGCFSFSPNKTVGTGQGGAIATNDDDLNARLRELKDQGRPFRGTGGADIHVRVGFNFKYTNLQSAIGLCQLDRFAARADRMRSIYRGYAQHLKAIEGLLFPGFNIEGGELSQWVDVMTDRRDELETYLFERGAQCRRFWFPLHTQAPYRLPDSRFPVAMSVGRGAMWLPSAFTLSDKDVSSICRYIVDFFAKRLHHSTV